MTIILGLVLLLIYAPIMGSSGKFGELIPRVLKYPQSPVWGEQVTIFATISSDMHVDWVRLLYSRSTEEVVGGRKTCG